MCFVWSRLKHTQKDTHVKVEQYYAIYWRTLQFHSSVKLKLEDVSGSASQGLSQRIKIETRRRSKSVGWLVGAFLHCGTVCILFMWKEDVNFPAAILTTESSHEILSRFIPSNLNHSLGGTKIFANSTWWPLPLVVGYRRLS